MTETEVRKHESGGKPAAVLSARWLVGLQAWSPVISRILAAVVGGYIVAALVSVAALALPTSAAEGVMSGMLLSFLAYATAVVWVFAARSAKRAWAGLLIVAAVLVVVAWLAVGRGAA